MLFAGARPISFWLNYWFGIGSYSDSLEEGNPIERAYYFVLFVLGLIVLLKRKLDWSGIFRNNKIICLYFLFCLISISWSDYPFVAFKRLFKTIIPFVMVLIVLTEKRPYAAMGFIMKRLAFVFLPLSVLFIHYYPIGKSYHATGSQLFTGVAGTKNSLGMLCLLAGIYLTYALFFVRRANDKLGQPLSISKHVILTLMLIWLFYKADSATALVCMIVAVGILFIAQKPAMKLYPNRFITMCLGIIVLFGTLELAFDIKNILLEMLGRRADLTTRVPMWHDLLAMIQNPLIGFGNESFWLGERLTYIQERYGALIQAHNGYIETYLNLGAIGLMLLLVWIIGGLKNILSLIRQSYEGAIFSFTVIVVACLYNWTEATLYGVNNLWSLFLFATLCVTPNKSNTDEVKENK
jgi:O-antigen ligase